MARPVLYGEEFDKLIKDHGIKCDYQPAIVCDCITKDSQQPLFTCPKCGGCGYRYLPKQEIRVVVTSFATKTEPEMMTLRESGTAYATPQPDIIMGFHDRLSFPDFKCKYSERLWISKGSNVTNKSYRNIKDVVAVLHGGLQFEAGIDYEISENGYQIEFTKSIDELVDGEEVEWTEDDLLPISILYYTTPSYLVMDILHELRSHYTVRNVPTETFEELPKQYRIRREDFIYNVKEIRELEETEPDDTVIPDDGLEENGDSMESGSGLFD